MADRRHPSDRVARRAAHRVGVGPLDAASGERAQQPGVEPVRSGDERKHGGSVAQEDERLDDLTHRCPDRRCGLLGRARAVGRLHDLAVEVGLAQRGLDAQDRSLGLHQAPSIRCHEVVLADARRARELRAREHRGHARSIVVERASELAQLRRARAPGDDAYAVSRVSAERAVEGADRVGGARRHQRERVGEDDRVGRGMRQAQALDERLADHVVDADAAQPEGQRRLDCSERERIAVGLVGLESAPSAAPRRARRSHRRSGCRRRASAPRRHARARSSRRLRARASAATP